MSRDLSALYQQVILDHNKNPRHYGVLDPNDRQTHGVNPLCGDDYHIYLNLDGERIADIRFSGTGCAISKSSASLMTTTVLGKTIAEAKDLIRCFIAMLTAEPDAQCLEKLNRLRVLEGVKHYPVRVKCATLAWRPLEAALSHPDQTVTTE
ncbi:MAG: Fe-S cluster assembly sulfur transfer protein SufU [Candidatus Margulisiibacteriota bacterium]